MPSASKEKNREYAKKFRCKNPGYNKKYHPVEKQREWLRSFRQRNPKSGRYYYLKATYDLTKEAYQALLESQNGKCKICFGLNADGQDLHVDHDHVTGRVRGLLCRKCNTMLGFAEDDTERLQRAIQYLRA